MSMQTLQTTIQTLAASGKGILAADESTPTITKRFASLHIDSTEENRRAYRDLLITTPNINQFISGVILFEETLNQKTLDGTPFPEKLTQLGILPGIKVDKGLVFLPNTANEQVTQGLDGLADRLADYRAKGALFAKWRAVYLISPATPTRLAIKTNAEELARYAALCQSLGIVPIVEPEVLIDGDHTIERCAAVTESVLHAVFNALYRHRVQLEYIVLKPNMAISGKSSAVKASVEQVAEATVTLLRHTVPAAVPTINFLSGGQSSVDATAHLNAMNQLTCSRPWQLSFSYARALQDEPMKIWQGKPENRAAAQQAFCKRAQLNSLASMGQYVANMEVNLKMEPYS